MPEIVCILNDERSKLPALAEKSKYLTINKHGNIALFKIFSFQMQNICILETIFPHYTTKRLKILAFWVISGADPGFLEGGFKSLKRGFVFNILSYFE